MGERYVAVLARAPGEEEMTRLDYALEAWVDGARPAEPLELFGYWRATVPEPSERGRPMISDDELLDLFDQFADSEDPQKVAFRYLLALILLRKRKLVYEGGRPARRRDGRAGYMLVRRRGADAASQRIIDPGMDDQQIDATAALLDQIMNIDDEAGIGSRS